MAAGAQPAQEQGREHEHEHDMGLLEFLTMSADERHATLSRALGWRHATLSN